MNSAAPESRRHALPRSSGTSCKRGRYLFGAFDDLSNSGLRIRLLNTVRRGNNVIRDLHRRLHHIDYRPGDRCQLDARASKVDRSRRYLSDRHRDHPRRDIDSTKGSAVPVTFRAEYPSSTDGSTNHPLAFSTSFGYVLWILLCTDISRNARETLPGIIRALDQRLYSLNREV